MPRKAKVSEHRYAVLMSNNRWEYVLADSFQDARAVVKKMLGLRCKVVVEVPGLGEFIRIVGHDQGREAALDALRGPQPKKGA